MQAGHWSVTRDKSEDNGWKGAFPDKAAAVRGGPAKLELKPGEVFYVGLACQAPTNLSARNVVQMMDDYATDEGPEGNDGFDVSEQAKEELDAFLDFWSHKHKVQAPWFVMEGVEEQLAQPDGLTLLNYTETVHALSLRAAAEAPLADWALAARELGFRDENALLGALLAAPKPDDARTARFIESGDEDVWGMVHRRALHLLLAAMRQEAAVRSRNAGHQGAANQYEAQAAALRADPYGLSPATAELVVEPSEGDTWKHKHQAHDVLVLTVDALANSVLVAGPAAGDTTPMSVDELRAGYRLIPGHGNKATRTRVSEKDHPLLQALSSTSTPLSTWQHAATLLGFLDVQALKAALRVEHLPDRATRIRHAERGELAVPGMLYVRALRMVQAAQDRDQAARAQADVDDKGGLNPTTEAENYKRLAAEAEADPYALASHFTREEAQEAGDSLPAPVVAHAGGAFDAGGGSPAQS